MISKMDNKTSAQSSLVAQFRRAPNDLEHKNIIKITLVAEGLGLSPLNGDHRDTL